MIRKLIARCLLGMVLAGIAAPALSQVPPAVPALPDTERRTSYSISGTVCSCSVNFALFNDSNDIDSWIEVWVAGTKYLSTDPTFGWSLSSVTGPLATIPRPITNAVLTFNAVQTGTVQIVGAQRPRRLSQFAENRGVAARDLNQVITSLVAMERELWDLKQRLIKAPPGETVNPMPSASVRANGYMAFDVSGNPAVAVPAPPAASLIAGTGISTSGTGPVTVSMANMAARTAKCNPTGSSAAPQDCTSQQTQSVLNASQCINITSSQYAGAGDNTTDNVTPLNNALAALSGTGGCIYFPPGKYKFTTSVSYSLPAGIFSAALIGSGQDNTILTWPNASGGITFNYAGISSSVHLRDLSLTTGTTNGGNAVTLNMASSIANPAVTAISDVTRVTMRGDDGYGVTDYWTTGLNITNVPNVQIENLTVFGASTPNGTGIGLVGLPGSSTFGAQYNVAKSTLQNLATGILYGSFIQGLSVDQTNFTFAVNGIASAPSETGALAQLSVTNSQFNPGTTANGNGILTSTEIGSVQITNNLFLNGGSSQSCVNLARAKHFAITGNEMQGIGSSSSNCIIVGTTVSSSPGVIAGNDIFGFGSSGAGIWLQGGSTLVNVYGNVFTANTNNIVNSGTSNVITNNLGYNPVGVSAAVTMGASPFTYTAGASPEVHYVRQSATNTATIAKGGQQIATLAGATTYYTIELGPNESYVTTWVTTAPTYTKDVH